MIIISSNFFLNILIDCMLHIFLHFICRKFILIISRCFFVQDLLPSASIVISYGGSTFASDYICVCVCVDLFLEWVLFVDSCHFTLCIVKKKRGTRACLVPGPILLHCTFVHERVSMLWRLMQRLLV